MSAKVGEALYPWERAVEQQHRVDFLFRTDVRSIIETYSIGSDWNGWPHVWRVMLAIGDASNRCFSFFGRAYRKRMFIQPCGGGKESPVWWFDAAGRALESHGYDPPVVRYVMGRTTDLGGGWIRVDEWVAENVIEQQG